MWIDRRLNWLKVLFLLLPCSWSGFSRIEHAAVWLQFYSFTMTTNRGINANRMFQIWAEVHTTQKGAGKLNDFIAVSCESVASFCRRSIDPRRSSANSQFNKYLFQGRLTSAFFTFCFQGMVCQIDNQWALVTIIIHTTHCRVLLFPLQISCRARKEKDLTLSALWNAHFPPSQMIFFHD